MLATWTIAPARPASIISRAAACDATSALTRLMSMWRRMLASGIVRNEPARTPPELFTSTSSRPNSAATCSIAARNAVLCVTSHASARARRCGRDIVEQLVERVAIRPVLGQRGRGPVTKAGRRLEPGQLLQGRADRVRGDRADRPSTVKVDPQLQRRTGQHLGRSRRCISPGPDIAPRPSQHDVAGDPVRAQDVGARRAPDRAGLPLGQAGRRPGRTRTRMPKRDHHR